MTKTITTRELQHNLPKVKRGLSKGVEYTVLHYGKPAFTLSPPSEVSGRKLKTFEDLLKIRFQSGEKNLSRKIDKIVYDK
ncbi:MAG: hypothetical protein COV07_01650 [Candidatus Vogelbacteria bacterium CG10_big_fil_rev_8_21_14_0_10_45_14]|uniref:Prevent-host-death protein n=1 Tax=Candidatus Vogelbacteria bacterium CG10_big_fil_rev_8_21_14_0_10_45_14 TaxID=1975042 RepID=A0A2H0RK87_9BACT|nr:MAG: hypothetical protein COV07_01650 [Candidatus Vogelbacteria bacterium CG10_big_fil_rev_8_21_14_0_10_45_14]